jgi:ABC-type multidrug transport system fused ATPase/permease subunit
VGRTGSGKSSITQAIFHLAVVDGNIEIDDVKLETLGLHTFRGKISIIPQDPVLFAGTLRINLDPFDEKTDDEIWSVLEQVMDHFNNFVILLLSFIGYRQIDLFSFISMFFSFLLVHLG